MLGTALKPSEVIQLTIVPSAHRQRGDGMSVPPLRGPLQSMTGPLIGCALNWGRDLGVARGHVLVQPRNKFYLKQNATAFVRERSDFSVACHLSLAIFVSYSKSH